MIRKKTSIPASKIEAGKIDLASNHYVKASVVAASVLLVSCAGQPPKETVSQAELAVFEASQTNAPRLAPLDLRKAQDHLDQAKQAMQNKDYTQARRLAENAVAEATLAEAKSDAKNSQTTLAELRKSLDALREETGSK
jgi:hypothetical protein